ncbi:hypothetical protein P7C71_g5902, partial [Lecanoromycetidae sp. Uapishka_2]
MPYHANSKAARGIPLAERFPAQFVPDTRTKILLLIVDAKFGADWAGSEHQAFIEQLLEDYNVYATTPASAVSDIKYKKANIILIIGADTLHRSCDREGTIAQLSSFAQAGGTVIFVGVPWGLSPDEEKDEKVFHALGLSWTVGATANAWNKRIANHPIMPYLRIKIQATYLKNVSEGALYRVCSNEMGAQASIGAQCPVAYQPYGDGYMAYLGHEDMFGEEAWEVLTTLCEAE